MDLVSNPVSLVVVWAAPVKHEDYFNRGYFSELDGVRGLAVLLVVVCHVFGDRPLLGELGVTLFFVLSGFLITTLCLREELKFGKVSLAGFYIRRSFRIFPLYFAVLAFYAVCLLVLHMKPEHEEVLRRYWPGYVLYYQEFVRQWTWSRMPFNHSWTLGVEEKFYLVWPLLCFGLFKLQSVRMRLALAAGTTMLLTTIGFLLRKAEVHAVLGRCLDLYGGILVGCCLALCLHDRNGYERIRRVFGRWTFPAVVALVLAVQWTERPKIQLWLYIFAATAWIGALLVGNCPLGRHLRKQLPRFVGHMSYGVYLIHVLVFSLVGRLLARFGVVSIGAFGELVMTVALSLAFSYGLSILIERPCIHFGRQLADSVRGRLRAASQTPRLNPTPLAE